MTILGHTEGSGSFGGRLGGSGLLPKRRPSLANANDVERSPQNVGERRQAELCADF